MGNEKRRMTIGVLVGGIMDDFTKLICRGAMQVAKQMDVNIVTLPGKYINRDLSDNPEIMYEYQFGTIFSYAKPENIDAIIVSAGSIGCFTDETHIKMMLQQFEGIPCVLVAYKLEGYPSVVFDNYSGIEEGLSYMIEKAGLKKFGMIGGSMDNTDAQERKAAFIKILEDHGIAFSEKMHVSGNFSRKSFGAYRELLDKNPDMEAVFCVNDDTAFGFYEEVKRRGMQVGKDIHILGYDDVIMATKVNPTLSSVRADATNLGEEALKMAVHMAHGEQVESKVLPTKFAKRDSIGNRGIEEEDYQEKIREASNVDVGFQDIFYHYNHDKYEIELKKIKGAFQRLVNMLVLVYGSGDDSPENFMEIQVALNEFLNGGAMEYADMNNLLNFFESFYRALKDAQRDKDERFKLQEMFSAIYRRIIRATDYRLGNMLETQEKENYSMKLFVRDMLQFEKGNDLSYTSMLGNLEWLDVKNAYVYTFKRPIMHLEKEQFQTPKTLYLKAVLKDGEVSAIPAMKQKVSIRDIFDNHHMSREERKSYVCMPLFSNEMLYGLILCDLTEAVFSNGEFLLNHMSSAVKMILLLQANEQIQQQLEESLAVLKENNIALDTLSKSDSLTGILNRRGFDVEAEKMIAERKQDKRSLLAIYVDMNNLKIINDRYGHDDGDFALRAIGRILVEEIGEDGIVGRIGGDEFACLTAYSRADEGEELLGRIYESFDRFNKDSDKPYNVTVSAGAYILPKENTVTLEEALIQADEKLYEVKKHRKKDVAKK